MMKSIELAARYSLMPNCLGYCGGSDFPKVFSNYLQGNATKYELKNAIKKFKGHYPYLKTIAKASGITDPFDPRVIKAFWIGNELLDNVGKNEIIKIITHFSKHAGMDPKRAEEKIKQLPSEIVLHHSFNSIYLNFVGDKVPRSVSNFDKCRIGWGKVLLVKKNVAQVEYLQLTRKNGRYFLSKYKKKYFLRSMHGIYPEPELKKGDVVSLHWGLIVQKLNRNELKNLKKYTEKVISAVNSSKL